MTDAKFSDIDGKPYKKEDCFKVSIWNYDSNMSLKFDMKTSDQTEKLEDLMKMAQQNNCKWAESTWGKNKK